MKELRDFADQTAAQVTEFAYHPESSKEDLRRAVRDAMLQMACKVYKTVVDTLK